MKKFFVLCLISSVFYACSKDSLTISFDLTKDVDLTFPQAMPVGTPFSLPSPNIATNSKETFEDNNTNPDKIKGIKLGECKFTVTAPSGDDFGFLKTIRLFINSPGKTEVEVASKTDIPDNVGGELLLDATGAELADYLKQDSISFRVAGETDEALSHNVEVKTNLIFNVTAAPLK